VPVSGVTRSSTCHRRCGCCTYPSAGDGGADALPAAVAGVVERAGVAVVARRARVGGHGAARRAVAGAGVARIRGAGDGGVVADARVTGVDGAAFWSLQSRRWSRACSRRWRYCRRRQHRRCRWCRRSRRCSRRRSSRGATRDRAVLADAALQDSIVQALPSSQSLAVVQGVQPAIAVFWQTPPEQESVVQAFWSLQSTAVEQSLQPAISVYWHKRRCTSPTCRGSGRCIGCRRTGRTNADAVLAGVPPSGSDRRRAP